MSKKQDQGCLLLLIPFTAVCICIVLIMSEINVGGFDSFLDGFGTTTSKPREFEEEDIKKMINIRNVVSSWKYKIDLDVWEDVTGTCGSITDTWKPTQPTIWVAY